MPVEEIAKRTLGLCRTWLEQSELASVGPEYRQIMRAERRSVVFITGEKLMAEKLNRALDEAAGINSE